MLTFQTADTAVYKQGNGAAPVLRLGSPCMKGSSSLVTCRCLEHASKIERPRRRYSSPHRAITTVYNMTGVARRIARVRLKDFRVKVQDKEIRSRRTQQLASSAIEDTVPTCERLRHAH